MNIIPSQLTNNSKPEYKDNYLEEVISLFLDNKITENQVKGMCLEISTYIALQNLGIFPIPLHNPFSDRYPYDSHLGIDLMFYHRGFLCGIECKNISSNWTSINHDWIDREVIRRFDRLKDIVPIDVKIVVTSVHKDLMLKYLSEDYHILEVGYQIYPENISNAITGLSKLVSSLLNRIEEDYSLIYTHGSNESRIYYKNLGTFGIS